MSGFLADLVGAVILFTVLLIEGFLTPNTAIGALFDKIAYASSFNPFDNIAGFLVVLLAVVIAAFIIYFLDGYILKKAGLDEILAKSTALKLALITAPYLYFFPSMLLY